jgi:hypothetical protein
LLGETISDIETIEMSDVTGPKEAAEVFLQNQISSWVFATASNYDKRLLPLLLRLPLSAHKAPC